MHSKMKTMTITITFLVMLGFSSISNVTATTGGSAEEGSGPFLDKIVYQTIESKVDMLDALETGSIDIIFDSYDFDDRTTYNRLKDADNIELAPQLRNGYGYMAINTAMYPLNYTPFRRAIAFSLNKTKIAEEVWDGLALPLDSPVPLANSYCVEERLPFNYYDAKIAIGNDLLDDTGFTIRSGETYRRTPRGDTFDITVEVAQSSIIAIECGQIFGEALEALHINYTVITSDFNDYVNRMDMHGDWDIAFVGRGFNGDSLTWLIDYESSYAQKSYLNFPGFTNASFDSYLSLLESEDYEEFIDAAYNLQLILAYESPIIPLYTNILTYGAYRTDIFQGFQNDPLQGVSNRWTYETLRLIADSLVFGGELTIGVPTTLNTLNFMLADTIQESDLLGTLYDSLMRLNYKGEYVPCLAESVTTQTYSENTSIPIGYTQLMIDLRNDVYWSDGSQMTADDVAFSFEYYNSVLANPYSEGFENLYSAWSVSKTRLYVILEEVSFWDFRSLLTVPIISKAEFEPIGAQGWDSWNPSSSFESMMVSGPFEVTFYEAGVKVELSANLFHFTSSTPVISALEDITIQSFQVGANLTWTASTRIPSSYAIYQNGTLIDSGDWDGSNIDVDLSALETGIYEYKLFVYDESGKSAHDIVIVTVTSTPLPINLSMIVTTGSIAVIVVVGGLIAMSRRN